VKVWDANMAGRDSLGRIYGYQWRKWGGHHDQLLEKIEEIKHDPTTRRAVVTGWNPLDIKIDAALHPCPVLFQLNRLDDELWMSVYQRSADAFLGLPFDVASHALLGVLIANELDGVHHVNLDYHVSNCHLYLAHADAAREELALEAHEYPNLLCARTVRTYHWAAATLYNYNYSKFIKAPLLS
jgi:thymidylate synthase